MDNYDALINYRNIAQDINGFIDQCTNVPKLVLQTQN